MRFGRRTHGQRALELTQRATPVLLGDKQPAEPVMSGEGRSALSVRTTQQIFRQLDLAVVGVSQSQQQRNAYVARQSRVCLREIASRKLRFSLAEEVFADEEIQSGVLVGDLRGALEFRDSLRDLLVLDQ